MQCVYDEGTKLDFFYERTYPLPFHFYERFSTPDLLCCQRRPLKNPSPASGRDKRGPPESSQNRKDSSVFGNAALPYFRKTSAQPPAATSAALPYLRKTAAQPPAATSAALPYLRKTAKIRRFSGGPRLSRPRKRWAASGGSSLSSAGRRRDRRPWRTRAPKCCTSRRSRT